MDSVSDEPSSVLAETCRLIGSISKNIQLQLQQRCYVLVSISEHTSAVVYSVSSAEWMFSANQILLIGSLIDLVT